MRSTESAPIYLVAPAGHPNYGDEFILRAWLRHLAVTRPDTEVVVDCHTPGQAAVLMGRCHPRVRFTDTIWRICFETAALPVPEAVEVTADIIDNPVQDRARRPAVPLDTVDAAPDDPGAAQPLALTAQSRSALVRPRSTIAARAADSALATNTPTLT